MNPVSPETKISLANLTDWPLYFKRIDGVGDIKIPKGIKNYKALTFNEVQMQIETGNVLFVGSNADGSHVRIQIVDPAIREQLFGSEVKDAVVLTINTVVELLAIKQQKAFKARLKELVTTEAEKRMIIELAKQAGAENSEAWKIEAIEAISGYKLVVTVEEDEKK